MKRIIPILICVLLLCSCSRTALHEAQSVVAEADSLRALGIQYDDSLRIAQSVATLTKWRHIYKNDYAKANYYYGRLLRNRDNYVAAMQCFIDASHSGSDDYNLLGRVYSNMGTMSHLAGEFELSYNMQEFSANYFVKGLNQTAYYFALYEMAFEKSELMDSAQTLYLTQKIERESVDEEALKLSNLSKANLFFKLGIYDSAIYYSDRAENILLSKMIKAQSYSFMGKKDSAFHYAAIVVNQTDDLDKLNNSLYILANDNIEINTTEALKITSRRADVQKEIEIRQVKLAQAVLLLRQDLNCEHHFPIITIIIIFIIISCIIGAMIKRKIFVDKQYNDIELSRKLLKTEMYQYTQKMNETNDLIQKLKEQRYEYAAHKERMREEFQRNALILKNKANPIELFSANNYDEMCNIIDKNLMMIAEKIKQNPVGLNKTQIRLCILVVINFDAHQIANILPYSYNSVGKLKDDTAKKLGTTGKNLYNFLINMAINDDIITCTAQISQNDNQLNG